MPVAETRVNRIDQGYHVICQAANNDYDYFGYRSWPKSYAITGDPRELPYRVLEQLKTDFSGLRRVVFEEARFREGSVSAVKLDYEEGFFEESPFGGIGGLLDLDGHIFRVGFGHDYRSSDRGEFTDDIHLSIEDRGSLKIVNNKLEHAPTPRDGKLSVSAWGNRAEQSYGGRMVGFVDYSGAKPGELVAASLEVVRQVVKEKDYPLWKKNPRS